MFQEFREMGKSEGCTTLLPGINLYANGIKRQRYVDQLALYRRAPSDLSMQTRGSYSNNSMETSYDFGYDASRLWHRCSGAKRTTSSYIYGHPGLQQEIHLRNKIRFRGMPAVTQPT